MPVWLTLFIALVATVGFFGSIYFLVVALVEGKRAKAKPKMGIAAGEKPGTLGFWITWDTNQFALSIYRIKVTFFSPEARIKEGVFSVTYDPPQKGPFTQSVELPPDFVEFLDSTADRKALVTYEMRAVEDIAMAKNIWVGKLRQVIAGKAGKLPKMETNLALAKADLPTVSTLEYYELVARTKKVKDMEAAAKAKAAKAAAAKAATAAPAAAATAPSSTPPETA